MAANNTKPERDAMEHIGKAIEGAIESAYGTGPQLELKFPLKFEKCPACGSKRRVAEIITNQEKAKGRVGKDRGTCIISYQSLVMDPASGGIIYAPPLITTMFDVCADCGTFYCTQADLGTARVEMKPGAAAEPPWGTRAQLLRPKK